MKIDELRRIAGTNEVFKSGNGQYFICPFGKTTFQLGAFESAKMILESKILYDFAQDIVSAAGQERIKFYLDYHEMDQERKARDQAKQNRGRKYGPWERFNGNPDNAQYSREMARVVEFLATTG